MRPFWVPIFEALVSAHPEVGPVMDLKLPDELQTA
jgi:hypothetical protein